MKLVIDGILSVMEERLEEGDVIQLGRLGNFRMVAGSKGVENEADFNTSFFNKARIVFSPGTMLTQVKKNVTFEHLDLVPAGDKPSSGGGRRNRVNCRPEAKFKQTKKLFDFPPDDLRSLFEADPSL